MLKLINGSVDQVQRVGNIQIHISHVGVWSICKMHDLPTCHEHYTSIKCCFQLGWLSCPIIFYANILFLNKSLLLPFKSAEIEFITILFWVFTDFFFSSRMHIFLLNFLKMPTSILLNYFPNLWTEDKLTLENQICAWFNPTFNRQIRSFKYVDLENKISATIKLFTNYFFFLLLIHLLEFKFY